MKIISVTAARRQLLAQMEQEQGLGLGMSSSQGLLLAAEQELETRHGHMNAIRLPNVHRSSRQLQSSGGVVVVYTVTVAGSTTSTDPNTPSVSASMLTTTLQSPAALASVSSNLLQSYPTITVTAPTVVNISPTSTPTLSPTTAPPVVNNNLVFGTTLTLIPFALAVGLPSLFLLAVLCYGLWAVAYPNHKCNYPFITSTRLHKRNFLIHLIFNSNPYLYP